MEKPSESDLDKERIDGGKPEPHQMIMALAFLIYEMNKCALSMTTQNVTECAKMMGVCKSIVKDKDYYLSLYDTLPTLAITEELAKINATDNARVERKNEESQKSLVSEMKTVEDIRILLVQLVAAAKSDKAASKMGARCDAITEGLGKYDSGEFNSG